MMTDEVADASSLPSSPVNSHFTTRPRRKTESAVDQTIHAPPRARSHLPPTVRFSTRTTTTEFHPDRSPSLTEFPGRSASARGQEEGTEKETTTKKRTMIRMGDDPRDTGRAAALRSSSSRPASFASSSQQASLPSPSSSPVLPSPHRLPQSRFSFEFHYPLRKRALTASHHASHGLPVADEPPSRFVAPDSSPLLYDRPRRSAPSLHSSYLRSPTAAASSSQSQSPHQDSAPEQHGEPVSPLHARSTVRGLSPNATKRRNESLYAQQTFPNVKRRMPSSTVTYAQARTLADDRDHAVNGISKHGQDDGSRTPVADDSRSKNEDIFLNIARSDSTRRESFGRSDLRRSRFRMSGSGLRSPASRVNSEQTASPDQLRLNTYDNPLHSNNGSPSTPYSSLSYSYAASAHPLDDHSRSHHSGYVSSSRSTIGLPRSRFSRVSPDASPRASETNAERRASLQDPRAYRHSTLSTIRGSRHTSTSEATERAQQEHDRTRHDGTESTLSTTAPSTVWDELEDLKSRIRKLELTGKLPPSSQEAISSASNDRPRTATTTVTTVSSSPRHGRKTSGPSNESDTITIHSQIHPLLQSAMAKAKSVLSKEVYAALEVTVTDALALSALLNSGKTPSGSVSVLNGYSSSERQSRRKADSVCRSLTELCLALSDEQLRRQQASGAEGSHGVHHCNNADEGTATPTLSFSRSTSQEPEGLSRRKSTTHAPSRLESRRTSLATIGAVPTENVQNEKKISESSYGAKPTPSPGSSAPASRLSRLSTSLRTRRLQQEDDNSEQRSSHIRSLSRSMTDIGSPAYTQRVSPRQRHSQLYSPSVHDSPQDQSPRFSVPSGQTQLPQPRTPTTSQSGLPLRRSLATPSYTPATSRSNIQAGSRRYGLSPAVSVVGGDGASDVPLSPAQGPSQTRITASSKLATSYTPIAQNRLRTNSLGARRFGLRQRQLSAADNAANSFDDSID
ncbi:conserved hypothetical protein [Aspergillus terreus NIH2624]|uniref:LPXTG-motif cell wall anchor domain protein n=1 Tax=Aspergillus terreus (strain NIH 2624 / FGSC A1156) TaxID=341663 RepID=Q0C9M1_ASPTN|nr:uncharacterized protein ATEG_09613 [Aspergillus terreus NIH2624]EAU29804.1 conserved hypothetical protein [Aspergillus terreus NIH2624]